MITYTRSAFGWKLIFRAHGSAVYRSVLPSLVAVALYFIFRQYNNDPAECLEEDRKNGDCQDVVHPYAVGVLVTTSTFLIVFKLNQSYNRYWEACGSTHQFMSKWMDAATHTSIYHMQCDHYAGIRPPSFYDYPELNSLCMTRDRERMNTRSIHQGDKDNGDNGSDNETGSGLRYRKQTLPHTSQSQFSEFAQPQIFESGNINSSVQNGDVREGYGRKTTLNSSSPVELREKEIKDEMKEENERQSVVQSINQVDSSRYKHRKRGSVSRLDGVFSKSKSVRAFNVMDWNSNTIYEDSVEYGKELRPLEGKPRLDGNWGKYFTKNPNNPLCTFADPRDPCKFDAKGFASIQGRRTPPLFLQELAHLSSLLNAVALSTLRNDTERSESPLAIYEPGQPWPEVDLNKDVLVQKKGFDAFVAAFKNFLGFGLTAEERSEHNAAQPLPVIGGVSDAEIQFLQIARGPYAKTQLCFNWLSEFIIREHLAGSLGNVAPPIISRIFQFLGDGMIYYNHARKITFIPFPFGHAQLSVIFVLIMVGIIPLLMHQFTKDPLTGAILTFLTVLCLEGINEVARDLENPFRNFPNELPLVNFQAQFNEGLITMYAGFHPDFFWDGDRVMRMAQSSGKGSSIKEQENSGRGLETTTPSDSYIKNITINVKPQKAGGNAPLDNGKDNTTEVAALKLLIEYQSKLIKLAGISAKTDDTKLGKKQSVGDD